MPEQPLHAVLLYPRSGFKPELRSDTLWGTICWAIRSMYGNARLEAWLKQHVDGQPPLLISSAFLFEETNGAQTFYLPRPSLPLLQEGTPTFEKMKLHKREKKVGYLPAETLQKMALGKLSNEQLIQNLRKELTDSQKLNQPQQQAESFTHNTIDRLRGGTLQKDNEAGQLFHDEERFVRGGKVNPADATSEARKKAGIYFLVQGDAALLDTCFRYLRHMGIGGDRSVGKGVFDHAIVPFAWESPQIPNAALSLSLFQPTPDQLAQFVGNPHFSYQLEERRGDVSFGGYGRVQKVRHTFFLEGSVFPYAANQPWGSIFDVRPKDAIEKKFVPHPVYQYGYALTLPFQFV